MTGHDSDRETLPDCVFRERKTQQTHNHWLCAPYLCNDLPHTELSTPVCQVATQHKLLRWDWATSCSRWRESCLLHLKSVPLRSKIPQHCREHLQEIDQNNQALALQQTSSARHFFASVNHLSNICFSEWSCAKYTLSATPFTYFMTHILPVFSTRQIPEVFRSFNRECQHESWYCTCTISSVKRKILALGDAACVCCSFHLVPKTNPLFYFIVARRAVVHCESTADAETCHASAKCTECASPKRTISPPPFDFATSRKLFDVQGFSCCYPQRQTFEMLTETGKERLSSDGHGTHLGTKILFFFLGHKIKQQTRKTWQQIGLNGLILHH